MDFIDAQALLDCLLTADELITFNGRIYDLIALEKILGEEALKPIWCKPHHDLGGWSRWELRASVAEKLSPNLAARFDSVIEVRKALLAKDLEDWRAGTLAGTFRDTKFTRHLFDQYMREGSLKYTFIGVD